MEQRQVVPGPHSHHQTQNEYCCGEWHPLTNAKSRKATRRARSGRWSGPPQADRNKKTLKIAQD
eukprot:167959-Chlamydomonas_euryale.AAC.1